MDKPKILYIDDDYTILFSAKMSLESICDITTQQSPRQAVELLKNDKFDIILLDISMPEWDGLEVLKVLRKDYPDLPVLMVSGWTSGDARLQQAKELGASGFVSKPFNRNAIKETIDEVLKKK